MRKRSAGGVRSTQVTPKLPPKLPGDMLDLSGINGLQEEHRVPARHGPKLPQNQFAALWR